MTDRFRDTRWSVVLSAASGGEAPRAALEWLCTSYSYPLYAYVRRRGYDVDAALDLTQGFFVSLLERGSLGTVDPALGRFRAFLLASMNHFLANERESDAALKRRAGHPAFLVDYENVEERSALESVVGMFDNDKKYGTDILDVIILNKRRRHRLLSECVAYYHDDRTHLRLSKSTSSMRTATSKPNGDAAIVGHPRIGGLHHRYEWRQAA